MNSVFNTRKTLDSWTGTYIALIPKEGWDLTLLQKIVGQYNFCIVGQYNTSLLNDDYEIFIILAEILKMFYFIYENQCGN